MDVIRNLKDKNCPALTATFKLIKVGTWYYWVNTSRDIMADEVMLDLAPFAKNRGLRTTFELIPFEDAHLQ